MQNKDKVRESVMNIYFENILNTIVTDYSSEITTDQSKKLNRIDNNWADITLSILSWSDKDKFKSWM